MTNENNECMCAQKINHKPAGTFHSVTDMINVLPGNSSVNTIQHAIMEEPVFPMRWHHAKMKEAVFSVHGPCQGFIGDNQGHLQSVVRHRSRQFNISSVEDLILCEAVNWRSE
jgi:hypothetical protein